MFDKLKSNESDFSFSSIESMFMILNKNMLYITHKVDKINSLLTTLVDDTRLQTQVDDFYAKGEAHLGPSTEDSKQEGT